MAVTFHNDRQLGSSPTACSDLYQAVEAEDESSPRVGAGLGHFISGLRRESGR